MGQILFCVLFLLHLGGLFLTLWGIKSANEAYAMVRKSVEAPEAGLDPHSLLAVLPPSLTGYFYMMLGGAVLIGISANITPYWSKRYGQPALPRSGA